MNFKGKKVTVMGLGLYENGSGISATKFLLAQGAKVTVTDLKTKTELAEQIKRLGRQSAKINWVLGLHRQQDFIGVDLVVKNPGVRSDSPYLKLAQKNHIPIETDISLFFQLVGRKRIIGVTGTRGKSTTTSVLYQIVATENKNAVIGGNIAYSPLAQLDAVKAGGPIILELSSWMLESLAPHHLSPYIGLFTNIYPDHLNTYDSMADYVSAKTNIFRWQNMQDIVILNRDNRYTKNMGKEVTSQRYWFAMKEFKFENGCFVRNGQIFFRQDGQEVKICAVKDIKLLGEHNVSNVLGAVCGAMVFGIHPAKIRQAIKSFTGLADRLELIDQIKGVKYYNDTTSTTPEATMAALGALDKKIILIMGGADKGLGCEALIKTIKKHCRAVVLLPGTGTDKLIKDWKVEMDNWKLPLVTVDSMVDGVAVASSLAQTGDRVLLSPAFASFGLFINEFDRGNQFKVAVSLLK